MKKHKDPNVIIDHDQNGNVVYLCLYCEEWYSPKKRWVQKYCSPSCCVEACRERNNGLFGIEGGTLSNKRDVTTNTELKKSIDNVCELINNQQSLDKINKEHDSTMSELYYKGIIQSIKIGFANISNKLTWQMALTVVTGFFASPIRRWVAKFFQKDHVEPLSMDNFKKKFEDDFLKKVPSDMQDKIKKAADAFFDQIK